MGISDRLSGPGRPYKDGDVDLGLRVGPGSAYERSNSAGTVSGVGAARAKSAFEASTTASELAMPGWTAYYSHIALVAGCPHTLGAAAYMTVLERFTEAYPTASGALAPIETGSLLEWLLNEETGLTGYSPNGPGSYFVGDPAYQGLVRNVATFYIRDAETQGAPHSDADLHMRMARKLVSTGEGGASTAAAQGPDKLREPGATSPPDPARPMAFGSVDKSRGDVAPVDADSNAQGPAAPSIRSRVARAMPVDAATDRVEQALGRVKTLGVVARKITIATAASAGLAILILLVLGGKFAIVGVLVGLATIGAPVLLTYRLRTIDKAIPGAAADVRALSLDPSGPVESLLEALRAVPREASLEAARKIFAVIRTAKLVASDSTPALLELLARVRSTYALASSLPLIIFGGLSFTWFMVLLAAIF